MRLVVNTLVMLLAMLAISLHQDADAAVDTGSAAAVLPVATLDPAIFDPAPAGFPPVLHFRPYKDEFAAVTPLPDIAPSLPVLGNLPPLKLLDLGLGSHAPKAAQSDKPEVKQEAALTPQETEPAPLTGHPAPSGAYMLPEEPAPTVEVPALPPRRPRDADRAHVPSGLSRIAFATPTLPPMGHTLFCLKYPDDCRIQKAMLHTGPITLTHERRAELVRVNADVNNAIKPVNVSGVIADKWLISPKSGNCNDFAVTKRHELLALGWPSRDLLLAEVVTTWNEHHLVLVVRTDNGDLVADSLNKRIRNWAETPYRWVRVETPDNPQRWATIQIPQPDLVAMVGHDNKL